MKYLYKVHEKNGTLDYTIEDLCDGCKLKPKCIEEGHENQTTVYRLEGCLMKKDEVKL